MLIVGDPLTVSEMVYDGEKVAVMLKLKDGDILEDKEIIMEGLLVMDDESLTEGD